MIYKGVPGGVLGWNPDDRADAPRLTAAQLTQVDHDRVAGGAARGSLVATREQFVATLEADVAATSTTTTTTDHVHDRADHDQAATQPATKPRVDDHDAAR